MPDEQHINLWDSAIAEVRRKASASQQDITPFAPNLMLIRQRVKVIVDRLRSELDLNQLYTITEDTQYQIRSQIREMVNQDQAPLSNAERGILLQCVLDEIFGFGPLGPLLRDPTIGDICVNGPQSICVKSKRGWEKSTAVFESKKHLLVTIEKILLPLGLRVDNSCPSVSAYLPNGSAAYVDPRERVITIGESTALRLQDRQWIKLESCPANEEVNIDIAEELRAQLDYFKQS